MEGLLENVRVNQMSLWHDVSYRDYVPEEDLLTDIQLPDLARQSTAYG